ncbi:MAG: prepilin peptidase [Lachnospiraceae bacterium]|nr:prepilin peptidase [Lachnospiraceae bacterium]
MQKVIVLGLLGICSLEDVRHKRLTIVYILMFGIGGVILHLFAPVCSIYSILCGMLLGIAMILVSLITRGNVGIGDGMLLLVTGVYLGGYGNLQLLMTGLLLSALWALGLLAFKKKKGKDEIAFAPFLLLAYFVLLFQGI